MAQVSITAWGLKRGDPPPNDLVFDVRNLKNPYWEPTLRTRNGFDPEVVEYICEHSPDQWIAHCQAVKQNVAHLLARSENVRVVVCCTGGRHRSVALASRVAIMISQTMEGVKVAVNAPALGEQRTYE